MLKYISKDDYKRLLEVSSIPDNFTKLAIEASNYINARTLNRIDICNVQEEIKYVACLIVDLINEAEQKKVEMGNLKSQNVEGWQESYQTPEEIDVKLEKDKYNILDTYLWNVIGKDGLPLLYCGVM